ncbi:hypothetical protein [Streptomyces zaomyceticus]|uniref:hypothetical protein n=1 Tax=Streptomyces zaomyceticus TaxID=68286 RepID=UPI002E0D0EC5|nr:hypothetical protein OG237_06475 [Streptomyces zaomyceticus]
MSGFVITTPLGDTFREGDPAPDGLIRIGGAGATLVAYSYDREALVLHYTGRFTISLDAARSTVSH